MTKVSTLEWVLVGTFTLLICVLLKISKPLAKSSYVEVKALVTAYCPCKKCCGKYADGYTATGRPAYTRGIAVDPKRIPYGTKIFVPGYGLAEADDCGAAMKKSKMLHIDVRFPAHERAVKWGRKILKIRIYKRLTH